MVKTNIKVAVAKAIPIGINPLGKRPAKVALIIMDTTRTITGVRGVMRMNIGTTVTTTAIMVIIT